MDRTVPQRSPEQQAAADRLAALTIGTPDALRAWAAAYGIPLINAEDDELLLISIHEARVQLPALPAHLRSQSRRWLDANRARIVSEREKMEQPRNVTPPDPNLADWLADRALLDLHEARVADETTPAHLRDESQEWLAIHRARFVIDRELS
jgi:hypothetical protein